MPTEPLYGLTPEDHQQLKQLIAWYRSSSPILNTRNRPAIERERDSQAPQLFIARTPSGGIPALDANVSGTASDDEPGSAECEIYQVLRYNNPTTISATAANNKIVYNLSTTAIPGDSWVIVARDGFGTWIALVSGGGTAFVGRGKISARLGDGIYSVQPIKRVTVGTGTGIEDTAWTNDGAIVTPCYRLPTEDDSPPPIPIGEGVLYGSDSVGYWVTPWGGQKKYTVTICRAVYCDNGNLVTVVRDWDHSARDNCWRESAG